MIDASSAALSFIRLACAACLLTSTAAYAAPAVELKILATDPAPDVMLARQQPFFVRFELKSAEPVTVTVSGLYKSKAVIDDGGGSAPLLLPAGGGTGVVNFFYWGEKPTRIDEVRLRIDDRASGAKLSEYSFPVALTWLMDDPPPRELPAWAKEWQQAQLALRNQAAGKKAPVAASALDYWPAVAAGALLFAIGIAWIQRRRRARADTAAKHR
ncbi:MAG: hypothetical protein K8S22_07645 [Betaproteobacteria bacterium]|nr:hypothetical protein [Betaproteobacteria bacterium]